MGEAAEQTIVIFEDLRDQFLNTDIYEDILHDNRDVFVGYKLVLAVVLAEDRQDFINNLHDVDRGFSLFLSKVSNPESL